MNLTVCNADDGTVLERLHEKGRDAILHEKPDSAIAYNTKLIDAAGKASVDKSVRQHYAAVGYNNIAFVYMFVKNDYQKAIQYLMKARNSASDNDHDILATIDQNFGHIYTFYAGCFPTETNISAAQDYYKEAFHMALKAKKWNDVLNSFPNLFNFGLNKQTLHKFHAEIIEFGKAPIPKNTPFYREIHIFYEALLSLEHGNTAEALSKFRGIENMPTDNAFKYRYKCFAIWNEALIYKDLHQTDSVYVCARKLERLTSGNSDLKDVKIDAYRLLYQYFETKGDKESTEKYKNLYFEQRDSLLINRNLNNVKSIYLMGNIDNLKGQVDVLEKQKRLQNIIIGLVVVVLILAIVIVIVLRRRNKLLESRNELLYIKAQQLIETAAKPKYKGSNLEETEKQGLQDRIQTVLRESKEIYNENFSLEQLSKLVDSSYHDVSQVINERFHQSFTNLLSEYRIMEACRRINDFDHYGQLTIEAIGMSVGFRNRSSFSRAFKRVTQLTPSEYLKVARNSEKATK